MYRRSLVVPVIHRFDYSVSLEALQIVRIGLMRRRNNRFPTSIGLMVNQIIFTTENVMQLLKVWFAYVANGAPCAKLTKPKRLRRVVSRCAVERYQLQLCNC
jgi:hypothetical protein